MAKKRRMSERVWDAADARTTRLINGSRLPSPGELQKRAMAHHGVDRMMVIENGVVRFITRR